VTLLATYPPQPPCRAGRGEECAAVHRYAGANRADVSAACRWAGSLERTSR